MGLRDGAVGVEDAYCEIDELVLAEWWGGGGGGGEW